VVYFNANADYDWRMNSSPSASQAFKDMANDPWFKVAVKGRLPE
jgi:hypothetical protein